MAMINFSDLLLVVTHPRFWFRKGITNVVFDEFLREALKCPKFEYVSDRLIRINGVRIFIGDDWYAYGMLWCRIGILPRRSTAIKLQAAVDKFLIQYEIYGGHK